MAPEAYETREWWCNRCGGYAGRGSEPNREHGTGACPSLTFHYHSDPPKPGEPFGGFTATVRLSRRRIT